MSAFDVESDGTFVVADDGTFQVGGCCCDETCECSDAVAGCYKIKDYSDGDLPAGDCANCPSSLDSAWDGTFPRSFSGCQWAIEVEQWSIDGKNLFNRFDLTFIRHASENPCKWEVQIMCGVDSNTNNIVWYGTKTTGNTPEGTYEYDPSVGDCNDSTAPQFIEIVEC